MRIRIAPFVLAIVSAAVAADLPYTDIPFVPTPPKVVDAMLDLAGVKIGDVLIDLGSGDGRIVIGAAKRFGIEATGVEIDPSLVQRAESAARQEGVSGQATFIRADLFTYDLRRASVVTMFLTPGVNLRLREKLLKELKPGTRVVSHRFDLGKWAPSRTIQVDGDEIFLWVVPSATPSLANSAPAVCNEPVFGKLESMFSYDLNSPLNAHMEERQIVGGASLTSVSFSGARGPISGTIIAPVKQGRYPAAIFVHDYGRRDEFLPDALRQATATPPLISLLIDSPPERPVGWRRAFNPQSADNDRDIHIQAVIDIRRGIDFLAAREDVDSDRIGYVGHGYGAGWGAILSAVEPRLRALVLIAGFPSFSELIDSDDPDSANLRYALGKERVTAYQNSLSPVDPICYTRRWAGAPVLFQFGRFDSFVSRAMADALATSIPRPQTAVFYDAGHSVNDVRAITDRARFLSEHLHSARSIR